MTQGESTVVVKALGDTIFSNSVSNLRSVGGCSVPAVDRRTDGQEDRCRQSKVTNDSVLLGVLLLLIPAVYTGEEDCLAFICGSHLSGVVNHALFIAAWAASVNHGALQLRVLLTLQGQWRLFHRVKDDSGADLLAGKLCYRNGKGAARAADDVMHPWERKNIPTLCTKVRISTKTRHSSFQWISLKIMVCK